MRQDGYEAELVGEAVILRLNSLDGSSWMRLGKMGAMTRLVNEESYLSVSTLA